MLTPEFHGYAGPSWNPRAGRATAPCRNHETRETEYAIPCAAWPISTIQLLFRREDVEDADDQGDDDQGENEDADDQREDADQGEED
jgi:hypothetical protein